MPGPPTVDDLKQFLVDDEVVAHALRTAADTAGVVRASDDLFIVEEEDVARLVLLGLDSLPKLREACQHHEPVVARLVAAWRQDHDSPLTPQELLWAVTYVLATEEGDPVEQLRSLVSNERWWQGATESHQSRFLERTVEQLSTARATS